MKKATTWDAADYLETEADIAAYLNAAFEDGDTSVIAAALGDVARAKGMTQLAKETSPGTVFTRLSRLQGIRHLIPCKKS